MVSYKTKVPMTEQEKSVVDRLKKAGYPDRKCDFNLTTNLTLLNDEIIEFVISNGINIMISIDGPQSVQDRYRIFVNGKGSFDTVMKKAAKLKAADAEFFQKCHTNTVISPNSNYEEICDFLDRDEDFWPIIDIKIRMK